MTVTFGDGTVVEIGTPGPSVLPLSAPDSPAIAFVPVKGDKGDPGDGIILRDTEGDPVTDKRVVLVINTDTDELDDILIEDV